jgi:putative ABC transport system permease protein
MSADPATSRLGLRDLVNEASAGLLQRPGRSLLTMLGTLLGVGAFVAIIGLSSTAAAQIDDRFNLLGATQLTVDLSPQSAAASTSFPPDAQRRVEQLNGVQHAGVWWQITLPGASITNAPPLSSSPGSSGSTGLGVVAADPGALNAMTPRGLHGRLYDAFSQQRGDDVAVLGSVAAARLGISRLDANPAVFVNGRPYTVVGIVQDFQRQPERALSVIIPTTTASAHYGPPSDPPAHLFAVVRLGAAEVVGGEVAVALSANHPEAFAVKVQSDPTKLRAQVGADVNGLLLLLAGVTLAVGALGIVNTTLVAVIERTAEIGLRRALGARPRHIVSHILAETTALGAMGGLAGSSLAVLVVLGTAVVRHWTAVLDARYLLVAPIAGATVGLLAGIYPALKAASIQPVEALRR